MAAKRIYHDGLIYNTRSDAATGRVVDRQKVGVANKYCNREYPVLPVAGGRREGVGGVRETACVVTWRKEA